MTSTSPTRLASGLLLFVLTACTRAPERAAITTEPSASAASAASSTSLAGVTPATLTKEQKQAFDAADVVAVATITDARIDTILEIAPPIYVHAITLTIDKRLAGGATPGTLSVRWSTRAMPEPLVAGTKVVVALTHVVGTLPDPADRWSARAIEPATPALEAAVVGKTAPDGLVLTVAQVPAATVLKWQNESGDGEFDLTVRNAGKTALTVPGVHVVGGVVQWANAVSIHDDQHRTLAPAHAPLPDGAVPLVLAPGASVTHRFDVKPFGLVQPAGGYNAEYSFRVGALRTSSWFYYTHTLHGPKMGKATAGI